MKPEYLQILKEIDSEINRKPNDKILLIDGLNLFLRNFAVLKHVNQNNAHIGGLGGFLRSLGYLIKLNSPTSIYVVFDGLGSSTNRKNLFASYKEGRNTGRITNLEIFEDKHTENVAQLDQIVRLTYYLKCLPIKVLSFDKVEADDVISFLATSFEKKYNSKVVIASNDKDFFQLINDNISVFKTGERMFYTKELILSKYNVLAENFILYKTFVGDSSDKIPGVKDIGEKTLIQLFPELSQKKLSLEEIFDICKEKLKEKKSYAKILHESELIKNYYKIMDIKTPLLSDYEKDVLCEIIEEPFPKTSKKEFMDMAEIDNISIIINNLETWLDNTFKEINLINKN